MSESDEPNAPQKDDGRAFAIDTVVVAVTQLIVRLRGLVLLPLLVKLLGTAAYGVWAQVVAFAMFLSALVSLNFHLPLVREIAAVRARAGEIYTTLLLATAIISGAAAAALALVPGPIAELLLDADDAARFIELGLVLMVANNVRMLNVNLYRATGRLAVRSVMELVTTIGEIIGVILLLRGGADLHAVFVFMAAWNGGIAFAQSVHCFAIVGWSRPRWSVVRGALLYAVPLIPASFANFALDRMDRFVVGYYHGAEGVGIYAANYALGGLVMMAQTPFQMTLLPKVAELWEADRPRAARYIEVSLMVFLTLAIPFTVGLPLVADDALTMLGNAELADEAGLLTFLIAAGVSLWGAALIQAQVLYGARRTASWGLVTIGGTAINMILNVILVPLVGISGAAAATFAAYAAIAVAASILCRSILPVRIDAPHLVGTILAAGGMAGFLLLVEPQHEIGLALEIIGAIAVYAAVLLGVRAAVPGLRGWTFAQLRSITKTH